MKYERTFGGVRYIAQVEEAFELGDHTVKTHKIAVYERTGQNCHHLPAFDAVAFSEHDARNVVANIWGLLAVRHAVKNELAHGVAKTSQSSYCPDNRK